MTNSNVKLTHFTWLIRLGSLLKVPLLGICFPKVRTLNSQTAEVQLSRWWLTSNHVGSMYFGALAMGAELSIATRLLHRLYYEKIPLSFIFKDASFQFLSRAEDHVIFRCDEVALADQLIARALNTTDRCDHTFNGYAYCVSDPSKKILDFKITLSVKNTKKVKAS